MYIIMAKGKGSSFPVATADGNREASMKCEEIYRAMAKDIEMRERIILTIKSMPSVADATEIAKFIKQSV